MNYYLLDAETVPEGVRLLYFNPQTGDLKEILDEDYRPYFYVPHPLSKADEEIIEELGAKTGIQEKKDLFSDHAVKVTKVELSGSSDPRWTSGDPYLFFEDAYSSYGVVCKRNGREAEDEPVMLTASTTLERASSGLKSRRRFKK